VARLARGGEHRRVEAILHTAPATGVVPVVVKMKGLSGFAFTLAISSRTSGESGTVCARPFFVLLPGMFQVAPSSLSSPRVMPATSFRLWPVSSNTLSSGANGRGAPGASGASTDSHARQ
jgi:hypothetical protein